MYASLLIGRKTDSESVNLGSNPSRRAKQIYEYQSEGLCLSISRDEFDILAVSTPEHMYLIPAYGLGCVSRLALTPKYSKYIAAVA